jgi:hypothetical protein
MVATKNEINYNKIKKMPYIKKFERTLNALFGTVTDAWRL